jgi:hypothetical protein
VAAQAPGGVDLPGGRIPRLKTTTGRFLVRSLFLIVTTT